MNIRFNCQKELCGWEFGSAKVLGVCDSITSPLQARNSEWTGSVESIAVLTLEANPKAPRTFAERLLAALKDIAHRFANIGVFQATSDIINWR
jgi:hypothetical protein